MMNLGSLTLVHVVCDNLAFLSVIRPIVFLTLLVAILGRQASAALVIPWSNGGFGIGVIWVLTTLALIQGQS